MKVVRDEAWQRFLDAPIKPGWKGVRIKDVRSEPLMPGGRSRLTLFEKAEDEGRAHPRLRAEMPAAVDPSPPERIYAVPDPPPRDVAALRRHLGIARETATRLFLGADLDKSKAPPASPLYWRNSIRAQRIARFFVEVRAAVTRWLGDGTLPAAERDACLGAVREHEDLAYSGDLHFDDADTGTYHSFRHDKPFVHYLERLLTTLPAEDTRAFVTLPPEQQESVRRQREQAYRHLDHLMRHKYAFHDVVETDIERSLGGVLIDRRTRHVVSETQASRPSLVPAYELLRIDPGAAHPSAGAWVHRAGDKLRLEDGTPVEVAAALLRAVPVDAKQLTFRRAPDSKLLRPGVRFDWDQNGYVREGPVDWIAWAGHCDIKAILEQLGVTLTEKLRPSVLEHRSEDGASQTYERDLLLEMVASVLELGSLYRRADGTGYVRRGIHGFGGARDDDLPDRLQFEGTARSGGFRWPLSGRQETFVTEAITLPDGPADPEKIFYRFLPDAGDAASIGFKPNPRFLKTVEGDYNVIDVSGARLEFTVKVDQFDPKTGYPRQQTQTTIVDLREPPDPAAERSFLGTHMHDAARRRIHRYYLERASNTIVGELEQWELTPGRGGDRWAPRPVPKETVRIRLKRPLRATLSREMKQDDPALFQSLLEVALRQAQNINADTDETAEVWNGTVTRLAVRRRTVNAAARVERWDVELVARFGQAALRYLLRRDPSGTPVEFCPVAGDEDEDEDSDEQVDFLWQDFPDVGSKGQEGGEWIVNDAMLERGIVELRGLPSEEGGFHIADDHIKNVFELIYCGLAGWRFTIVHANKRYGFRTEAEWRTAVDHLSQLRARLRFSEE